MAHIQIDPAHRPIIDAAIKMGDWLLTQPQVDDAARQVIEKIQLTLNQLPEVNDNSLVMYGVSVEKTFPDGQGLIRGWDVSLEYFSDDPEMQGGLECFSSYIPVPDSEDPEMLKQKKEQEVYFHWPIGDVCNFITPQKAQTWLNVMQDPQAYFSSEDNLRIELVYANQYVEVDL
jgi:hypothetical protein